MGVTYPVVKVLMQQTTKTVIASSFCIVLFSLLSLSLFISWRCVSSYWSSFSKQR